MAVYKYLLLDADNTLFDFDRAEETAFYAVFSALGIPVTPAVYKRYHEINDDLWRKLERKEVTRERLKDLRYELLLDEMGISNTDLAKKISRSYFSMIGQQRFLLPGALDVCRNLSEAYPMYIITNGSYKPQRSRFIGSGLEPYFRDVFISEKIGAEKPSSAFFNHVMQSVGDADTSRYLVVGDSLTSDMDGAILAGMDAVWLDRSGSRNTRGRDIPYIIDDIRELPALLLRITEK